RPRDACSPDYTCRRRALSIARPRLDEERKVLREQDVLVEDDHAPGYLPAPVHPPQHVLTLADEHVGFRLDAIAVDEEPAPDGDLGRRRSRRRGAEDLDVRDHVTDARGRLLRPVDSG